jgi:ATP-dependent helicase Lhr and Lhr-like helicase
MSAGGALGLFHPLVSSWFEGTFGAPTDVQERTWPVVAAGAHVLVSAPTGTGKTLAAFLWGINQLATGALPPGKVRILYVSPLKALNNDVQRNLLEPLEGIGAAFRAAGQELPRIGVQTRSGDTPSSERQRMLRHPPEILITTPESLNLILGSPRGRLTLDGLAVVILDEIHAVAATKRGTHLVTAVERLALLAGEVQRIALSATVKPLSVVADLVGGWRVERAPSGGEARYEKRVVQVVNSPSAKVYEIGVSFPVPDPATAGTSAEPVFDALARECRRIIAAGRSTLFFVNSRRHAEKLARFINEGQPAPLAWAHHGSLSRELRLVVEQRLKKGELPALVATSSLELGIDIGALDRVILVSTPFSVSSAVQRLGRAGHRVGEASRGVIYPLHGKDIVDAAVMARCVREQDINEVVPVANPLDVLAQLVVSMTSVETWKADHLYDAVRAGSPFHALPRRQFDLVLEMLAGRYAETRLRDLSPLVSWDRIDGTVRAKEGARLRLATSGGTIPDRGYFALRAADSKALIGELDEEFVWERSLGDTFVFGTQGWRIQKIDHLNVEVAPVPVRVGMAPFWKGEERSRDFRLSERISRTLEEWNDRLEDPGFPAALEKEHGLDGSASAAVIAFLGRQREATGTDLPHRHHLLVEHTRDPGGAGGGRAGHRGAAGGAGEPNAHPIVIHTLWGGRVNRPFALALGAAWEERHGYRPEMFQTDDALLLALPEESSAEELLSLVEPGSLERLLRRRLEGSGFFGARFREAAGRALLLPRASARGRTPLWLTRQRAKSLYSAVSRYDDFPLLLEAWRACLVDEFDLDGLAALLDEVRGGVIRVGEVATAAPSPFCGELLYKQTNTLMYADDSPAAAGGTALRGELVRELALSAELRPRLAPAAAALFQEKLQRTAPGYAPRDARELLDWLKERVLVRREEWDALLAAAARDHGVDPAAVTGELGGKVVERVFGELASPVVLATELLPRVERALGGGQGQEAGLAELLGQWLRFYGPLPPARAAAAFGLARETLDSLLEDLVEEEQVVLDRLLAGSEDVLLCDRENLEALLRISRAGARPEVRTLPARMLPVFVARRQGILAAGGASAGEAVAEAPATETPAGAEHLKDVLERLFGVPLPAAAWEEEVFPARMTGYRAPWLDALADGSRLLWLGCGTGKLTFCFPSDVDLFLPDAPQADESFLPAGGRYSFWDLASSTGLASAELARRLWDLAWKGVVSSDSFPAVRRGIAGGFRAEEAVAGGSRGRRSFDRWKTSRPSGGYWFRVPRDGGPRDALDEEELARDRARQVLQRYGVVFRELLESELPALRWPRLFRSLRLMEFSGEVVTGRFFDGVRGLQFALPSAVEDLAAAREGDGTWWVNAADPASLCGVDVEGLKASLPSRIPSTHVVFDGSAVVLVSRRRGQELEFRVPPEAPRCAEYLGLFAALTRRESRPLNTVRVERINGEPALQSPYRPALAACGFVEDYRRLVLRARV